MEVSITVETNLLGNKFIQISKTTDEGTELSSYSPVPTRIDYNTTVSPAKYSFISNHEGFDFERSDVVEPTSTDEDDLFDKLSEMCGVS